MNQDIRLSVKFFDHPKTIKLERRLGVEGVESLLCLWLWTAQNRPSGVLSEMNQEDVERVARWKGLDGELIRVLIQLEWLDFDSVDKQYSVHNWLLRNPHLKLFSKTERLSTKVWRRLKRSVFERDEYVCRYCGIHTREPHCDHRIPLSRGGDNSIPNLVTACSGCNLSKGSKTLEEWLQ